MIKIMELRIIYGMPGGVANYIFDARFVDESKGCEVKKGINFFKWDKCVSFGSSDLNEGLLQLEEAITQVLCKKRGTR